MTKEKDIKIKCDKYIEYLDSIKEYRIDLERVKVISSDNKCVIDLISKALVSFLMVRDCVDSVDDLIADYTFGSLYSITGKGTRIHNDVKLLDEYKIIIPERSKKLKNIIND